MTPLAAAVSGFASGLERGLARKGERRQAVAERASREAIARGRVGRGVSEDLTKSLLDITDSRQEEARAIRREIVAKQKQFADPLFTGEKEGLQSEINVLRTQVEGISKGITDIAKSVPGVKLLGAQDQAIVLGNLRLFTTGTFGDFAAFEQRIEELSKDLSPSGKKIAKDLALSAVDTGDIGIIEDDPSVASPLKFEIKVDDALVDIAREELP